MVCYVGNADKSYSSSSVLYSQDSAYLANQDPEQVEDYRQVQTHKPDAKKATKEELEATATTMA